MEHRLYTKSFYGSHSYCTGLELRKIHCFVKKLDNKCSMLCMQPEDDCDVIIAVV